MEFQFGESMGESDARAARCRGGKLDFVRVEEHIDGVEGEKVTSLSTIHGLPA
jgi:hypothetical protein